MTEQQGQEPNQQDPQNPQPSSQPQQGEQNQQPSQGQQGQEPQQGQQQSQQGEQNRGLQDMSPEQLQNEVTRLRRENAGYRTERNSERDTRQEMVSALSQALGLTEEGAQDPKEIQSQLDARNQDYNRERTRNQVYQAALAQSADPSLAWALLYSENTLANADPDGEGFRDLVNAEVANLVQSNPRVAADFNSQPQTVGGGGSNPPSEDGVGETNPWSAENFNMTEQGRMLRDEPEKARRMKAAAGYK